MHQRGNRKHQHGQIFVLLAIFIPILIVFVGLAVDFGMAYITKTTLSKAVDAAALAAMKNLNEGETQAAALAGNVFLVNYQSVPGLGTAPTPTTLNGGIVWSTDANNNTLITVSATATINTYFLGVLGSSYKTLNLTESAQAIRNPLVMSLVNDKSGSMKINGGATVLPGDVIDFLGYFDQGVDNIAEISFSTVASTDVTMTTEFVTPITNAVNAMSFGGGTFAQGGLQNGFDQVLTIAKSPNIIRVAVFFTDGYANTNNDNLNCNPGSKTVTLTNLNYGGCSPVEDAAGWCSGVTFMNPITGAYPMSCSATTFPVQAPGNNSALSPCCGNRPGYGEYDVTTDATYRTEQLAATMRNSTNDITIYSIGLGNKINEAYLQDIANDPAAATFDNTQPQGAAVFAPTTAALKTAYETIASKILLRLSK